jgi:hypothetical protein
MYILDCYFQSRWMYYIKDDQSHRKAITGTMLTNIHKHRQHLTFKDGYVIKETNL